MSKESYLTALRDNSQKITAYREKQLLDAGRDDLLPLMEELEANLYQYNEVDAELLSSQHDFQDGTITQQQYNSVVQAYEQLLKELDEEIDQLEEASALKDIAHMPARVKCAVLGWHTLDEAFKKVKENSAS